MKLAKEKEQPFADGQIEMPEFLFYVRTVVHVFFANVEGLSTLDGAWSNFAPLTHAHRRARSPAAMRRRTWQFPKRNRLWLKENCSCVL